VTVRTVLGDINAGDLGVTLSHEHVLGNSTQGYWHKPSDPEKARISEAPYSFEILSHVKRFICLNKDNLVFDSANYAIFEYKKYKAAGGNSVADVSNGRDIREQAPVIQEISRVTGVNMIPSTGWYISATHPSFIGQASVQELRDFLVKELTQGIGNTGIRAGIIGELGCSGPLRPDEKKVLQAGAKAQRDTGAPLTVHVPHFDYDGHRHVREAHKYVEILEEAGAVPERVYMSHMDFAFHLDDDDIEYQKKILDKGITLSYDRCGLEAVYDEDHFPGALEACTDIERVNAIVKLCKSGYEKQLMLAHDAGSMKIQRTRYGGYGYAHVLEHIVPMLKHRGVTESQVRAMLVDTPRRIFDW